MTVLKMLIINTLKGPVTQNTEKTKQSFEKLNSRDKFQQELPFTYLGGCRNLKTSAYATKSICTGRSNYGEWENMFIFPVIWVD